MIDIFFCVFEPRGVIQQQALDHWRKLSLEYKANLSILVPEIMPRKQALAIADLIRPYPIYCMKGPQSEFQRQRRIAGERLSKTQIYVVADDDAVLDKPEQLPEALLTALAYPQFAVLTPMPSNAKILKWTPEDYEPFEDEQVQEHVDSGMIRFCRKGIMSADPFLWTPQPERTPFGWKYDRPHAEQIRAKGYRIGYMKKVTATHLGERLLVN